MKKTVRRNKRKIWKYTYAKGITALITVNTTKWCTIGMTLEIAYTGSQYYEDEAFYLVVVRKILNDNEMRVSGYYK